MANFNLKAILSANVQPFIQKLDQAKQAAGKTFGQMQKNLKGMGPMFQGISSQLGGLTSGIDGMLGSAKMLANPYVAVGAGIAAAGAAWFKYNVELEKTKLLTEQFLGVTGNELSAVRAQIKSMATVFNKDFRGVLSATEAIMRQFGTSASEAADILQAGFVAGADDGGELLSLIEKYGPALRDAGIAADEMMALMAQTRSGLFNEKALDLIKEAGKNFRIMAGEGKLALANLGIDYDNLARQLNDGSINMIDIVRKVSQEINKLPEGSTKAAQAMKALYSEKFIEGGEQLIRSFANLSTNLDEVKYQTGIVGKAQEDLINATTEWEMALDSLFGSSKDGFSTWTTQLKTGVLRALTSVVNALIDLYNTTGLIRGAWHGMVAVIMNVVHAMERFFKDKILKMKTLGKVLSALIDGDFKGATRIIEDYEYEQHKINVEFTVDLGKDWKEAWDKIENGKIHKVHAEEYEESSPQARVQTAGVQSTTKSLDGLKNELAVLEKARNAGDESATTLSKIAKLKQQIAAKEIELGIRTTSEKKIKALTGSLQAYKEELQEVQKQRDAGLITPEVAQEKIQDLEVKIEDKEYELGIKTKVDKNSLTGLQNQLSEINKQISDGEYFELNPTIDITLPELIAQKVKIEDAIDVINVKVQFEVEKKKLDLEASKILITPEFSEPDKSSFEKWVAPEVPQPTDKVSQAEFKLTGIEEQMNLNDQLIDKIKTLMANYEKLGATGSESYQKLQDKLSSLNETQTELGTQAQTTFKGLEDTKKSEKNIDALGSSFMDFGTALGSIGSAFELPELNIAGVIAQGISQMVLGAGEAIAQASALGPIGWIAASLAIASTLAAIVAQVHQLSSFASGGLVHGSISGDQNIVRVNGNEMILNDTQQHRLWRIISGQQGVQSSGLGEFSFVLKGSDIYGALKNYGKSQAKLGKNIGIK